MLAVSKFFRTLSLETEKCSYDYVYKYQKYASRVRGVLPNNFSYKIFGKEFTFSRAVDVQQFY